MGVMFSFCSGSGKSKKKKTKRKSSSSSSENKQRKRQKKSTKTKSIESSQNQDTDNDLCHSFMQSFIFPVLSPLFASMAEHCQKEQHSSLRRITLKSGKIVVLTEKFALIFKEFGICTKIHTSSHDMKTSIDYTNNHLPGQLCEIIEKELVTTPKEQRWCIIEILNKLHIQMVAILPKPVEKVKSEKRVEESIKETRNDETEKIQKESLLKTTPAWQPATTQETSHKSKDESLKFKKSEEATRQLTVTEAQPKPAYQNLTVKGSENEDKIVKVDKISTEASKSVERSSKKKSLGTTNLNKNDEKNSPGSLQNRPKSALSIGRIDMKTKKLISNNLRPIEPPIVEKVSPTSATDAKWNHYEVIT